MQSVAVSPANTFLGSIESSEMLGGATGSTRGVELR